MPDLLAEAIQAGCRAADIHLTCSYPNCKCRNLPDAIIRALAFPGLGDVLRLHTAARGTLASADAASDGNENIIASHFIIGDLVTPNRGANKDRLGTIKHFQEGELYSSSNKRKVYVHVSFDPKGRLYRFREDALVKANNTYP